MTFHNISPSDNRYAEGILNLTDNKDTVKRTDTVQFSQSTQYEFLVMAHITGIHFKLIVIFARRVEALDNLINAGYNRSELTAEIGRASCRERVSLCV